MAFHVEINIRKMQVYSTYLDCTKFWQIYFYVAAMISLFLFRDGLRIIIDLTSTANFQVLFSTFGLANISIFASYYQTSSISLALSLYKLRLSYECGTLVI
jgi:hypothetical protein